MPLLLLAGGAVVGGVTGAISSDRRSKENAKQAEAARKQAEKAHTLDKDQYHSNAANARGDIFWGNQAGNQALLEGMAGAGANMSAWGQLGKEEFQQGMGQARQDTLGGMLSAQQSYAPLTQMLGYANQAGGHLGGMLGQDPFANFQADPGYQFRQQQGEEAINRAASAAGGRASGRTLKDLAQFNSGLASQEYQNFANRQLANQQNQLAMTGQLGQLGNIGATAQGNLANMQYGGGLSLAQQSQNLGQGLGNMSMQMGSNLGNLGWQGAQSLANMLYSSQAANASTRMGAPTMGGYLPSGYSGGDGGAGVVDAIGGGVQSLMNLGAAAAGSGYFDGGGGGYGGSYDATGADYSSGMVAPGGTYYNLD